MSPPPPRARARAPRSYGLAAPLLRSLERELQVSCQRHTPCLAIPPFVVLSPPLCWDSLPCHPHPVSFFPLVFISLVLQASAAATMGAHYRRALHSCFAMSLRLEAEAEAGPQDSAALTTLPLVRSCRCSQTPKPLCAGVQKRA